MKKQYIIPALEVIEIEDICTAGAGSPGDPQTIGIDSTYEDGLEGL